MTVGHRLLIQDAHKKTQLRTKERARTGKGSRGEACLEQTWEMCSATGSKVR